MDWHIPLRIAAAVVMGGIVAWIHGRTSRTGTAMAGTLVLLAGLIGMVTQVIGDNVARAFSLVGALSIVRFRTVLRDTRDTAFVIFAVVAGMAAGAEAYWLAIAGIVIVGAAAFVLAGQRSNGDDLQLRVRAATGVDLDREAGELFASNLHAREVVSVATSKQGEAIEYVYSIRPKPGAIAEDFVRKLNAIDGVQDVRWQKGE